MTELEIEIQCPFCGETLSVLVDPSQDDQDYIEDCQVCCRPIHFHVRCADGELESVDLGRE